MDKIKDLGLEFGEIIVDNREFSEAIKDFPILRTISVANDIRNIIFISKLESFLKSLEDIPKEKIKNEILKIDMSEKYRKKIGHNLINLIDRSFEEENSENIAILFRAFLEGNISYEIFCKVAKILTDIDNEIIRDFLNWSDDSSDEDGSFFMVYGLCYFNYTEVRSDIGIYNGEDYESKPTGYLEFMYTDIGEVIIEVFNELKTPAKNVKI